MAVIAPAAGFDTPAYARRLKAAGVDEAQAEARADAAALKPDLEPLPQGRPS